MSRIEIRVLVSWALACAWFLGVSAPGTSAAQPQQLPLSSEKISASESEASRPWAAGVSQQAQALALELYVAGNLEFGESRFAQALAKYREAIRHWDHPAIRYNMAVCLIHLDQPVEARDNLERSLVHGVSALGAEAHAQSMTYRKLLDAQLTRVTISCPEPDALVTLDGKLLFTAPGSASLYLLLGEHQVIATKPGMEPALQTFTATAGKPLQLELRPTLQLRTESRMVRRWDPWKPWSLVGGGGALAALGTVAYFVAKSDFAAYDRGIAAACPNGCDAMMLDEHEDLARTKKRAEIGQIVAFSFFTAGGAAVLAGIVGVVMNQPRMQLDVRASSVGVTPVPGGAAVTLGVGF